MIPYQILEDSAFFKREITVHETVTPRVPEQQVIEQEEIQEEPMMVPYQVVEDSAFFKREVHIEETETPIEPKIVEVKMPQEQLKFSPPVITVKVSQVTSLSGQNAMFKCEFTGNPTKITWFRNDIPIQNSHKYHVS